MRSGAVRRPFALLALALAAGACDDATQVPPSGTPTTVPAHFPAALGEEVEIALETQTGGRATLGLTVESVEVTESCPGRAAETQDPLLGYFVHLDVSARLDAAGEPGDGYVAFGAEFFRIMSPDGEIQSVSATDASWACFEDDELAPAFIDVGETVSGRVVLDSASPRGVVLLDPSSSDIAWGWGF